MESTLLKNNMYAALRNEDLLQNILGRQPALSFASAARVSKSWNKACNQILNRPKLVSALSISSSLHVAVKEILDKVLSEPIRPHFAIAYVGLKFNLATTHRLIAKKLGSQIPIITKAATGIIGMDAHTNEMKEAKMESPGNDDPNIGRIYTLFGHFNYSGIVLVVGFVPGLKVDAIPLLGPNKGDTFLKKSRQPKAEMIDKFLMDIKEYTLSVSDCTSPDAIIMFGDQCIDIKPVLVQMDNNMPTETVIVGEASGSSCFQSRDDNRRHYIGKSHLFDAVALVFTKDNLSSDDRGKIEFHVALSSGIIPFGPILKVDSVSVTKANCSLLTARLEEFPGLLDIWGLFQDILEEIEDENPNLYIGVMHQKVELQQFGSRSHVALHKVLGAAGQYIFAVDGVGIKAGDSFVFYHSDSETTNSSKMSAFQDLEILETAASSPHEIIGGLIFSSCCRGGSLPGCHYNESWPITINYPGIPVAGVFCAGEIARVFTSLIALDDEVEVEETDGGEEIDGIAMQEVIDKVLSEPIRPHFAIANVGPGSCLKNILPLVMFRRDEYINDDVDLHAGIVLTIGFVPGLKVDVIPKLRTAMVPEVSMIDQFVMDIRNYTISVSGCTSPIGIIMFGDQGVDQRNIVEKLDYALSRETVIVGDEGSRFLYRSRNDLRNVGESPNHYVDAVALVFASDRDKPQGTGEIQFHVALSKGVSAVGPRHKAVSVRTNNSDYVTWLTARREGGQVLDGQQILDNIYDELENRVASPELYIGVTKRRKCSIGSEKTGRITSLAFHGVARGDEEYLYVDGYGIKSGDYFQFYHSDPNSALAACQNVSLHLRNLKLHSSKNCLHTRGVGDNVDRKEVLGGFIFSCCGRGDSFFGRVNVDSSPFLENFPEAPLAGINCAGEIGRGSSSLMGQESQEESSVRCCLHYYSTVYLLMSYTPAPSER
ncbi:hypothetical protein EZV62_019649 [Acer yangbiense]|uniref:FIST C-domain domain-containing protein n=1 Tax=Acer yangbiense TaxID=1000413 RepID=A0A5C7HB58_9ROSI|nr:hypothetical protein EZV62_019649 [Acer yangbiense]